MTANPAPDKSAKESIRKKQLLRRGMTENQSLETLLALLPEEQRSLILADLSNEEVDAIAGSWRFTGRPNQFSPVTDPPFLTWLLLGGRGSGKSRSLCEWVHERIEDHYYAYEGVGRHPMHRIGAAGRSTGDVRESLVEGESGLMAVAENRGIYAKYEPSKRRISWPDLNARATLFTAEEPDTARGPQYHTVACDEFAAWDFSVTDDIGNNLWTNLMFGLRLGENPQAGLATTPKRIPELRELVEDGLDEDNYLIQLSMMSSMDNAANLSPVYLSKIIAQYEGTKLYNQEVLGLLLDDDEDMLWSEEDVAAAHRFLDAPDKIPGFDRVIVAVDPPGNNDRDYCGIIVLATLAEPLPGMRHRCIAVLADRSRRGSPAQWGKTVVDVCEEFGTTEVIAERNQGHEMVRFVVQNEDDNGTIKVKLVNAKDNKIVRAEPVAQLYEQRRVAHVERFPLLEDEMVMWVRTQKKSPDRLDALVHGATELLPSINQPPSSVSSVSDMRLVRARIAAAAARSGRGGPFGRGGGRFAA